MTKIEVKGKIYELAELPFGSIWVEVEGDEK